MTLSAIKSMFIPGAYWRCDRTTPWPNQKGIFRRVSSLRVMLNCYRWNLSFA